MTQVIAPSSSTGKTLTLLHRGNLRRYGVHRFGNVENLRKGVDVSAQPEMAPAPLTALGKHLPESAFPCTDLKL